MDNTKSRKCLNTTGTLLMVRRQNIAVNSKGKFNPSQVRIWCYNYHLFCWDNNILSKLPTLFLKTTPNYMFGGYTVITKEFIFSFVRSISYCCDSQ